MAGRKKGSQFLTPLELLIMQVLWRNGPSNVQQVRKNLPEDKNLAYTTVQTVLNALEKKGRVKRKLVGRAYEYRAAVSREKAVGQAVREFVDKVFGGSSEALVMSLMKRKRVDPERIAELSREFTEQGGDEDDE